MHLCTVDLRCMVHLGCVLLMTFIMRPHRQGDDALMMDRLLYSYSAMMRGKGSEMSDLVAHPDHPVGLPG